MRSARSGSPRGPRVAAGLSATSPRKRSRSARGLAVIRRCWLSGSEIHRLRGNGGTSLQPFLPPSARPHWRLRTVRANRAPQGLDRSPSGPRRFLASDHGASDATNSRGREVSVRGACRCVVLEPAGFLGRISLPAAQESGNIQVVQVVRGPRPPQRPGWRCVRAGQGGLHVHRMTGSGIRARRRKHRAGLTGLMPGLATDPYRPNRLEPSGPPCAAPASRSASRLRPGHGSAESWSGP